MTTFVFIHTKENVVRIISGYKSISAIKAAGLNTRHDFKEKFISADVAKKWVARQWPGMEVKTYTA